MRGENKLVGIGKNWKKEILIGLIIGIGFYTLSQLVPEIGSIGLPPETQAIGDLFGKILLVVLIAPIVEEIAFRGALLSLLDKQMKLNFFLAALISSVVFSLYHLSRYTMGGSISIGDASSSFILAGVVGFGLCYLRRHYDSLVPSIAVHAALNFLILNQEIGILTI